jgi:LysM repeat protein
MATPTVQNPSSQTNTGNLGVYLRQEQPDLNSAQKELDVLWSQNNTSVDLHHIKEEHHPLLTFTGGLVVGAVLTGLLFWVFSMRPQTPAMDALTENPPQALPVQEEVKTPNKPNSAVSSAVKIPAKPAPDASTTSASKLKGSLYVVKSGDTLGAIAQKFYGSSAPDYISRIKKANNLNGDALKLDQELVIPPKSY